MYCHKARAQASQRTNEGKQARHKHTDTDTKQHCFNRYISKPKCLSQKESANTLGINYSNYSNYGNMEIWKYGTYKS